MFPDWFVCFNKFLFIHAVDFGWSVVWTVLDLNTFVIALGTEKNFFDIVGVVAGEELESESVIVLDEGVVGSDFGVKDEGVENSSKLELEVELAPGL